MKEHFREKHLLLILKNFAEKNIPLDVFLSKYFRSHKSIGSKDRNIISEKIYTIIRWQALIDYYLKKPFSWEKRISFLRSFDIKKACDPSIPLHIQVSFPKDYFHLIQKDYGTKTAQNICLVSNETAPTTIRVNSLKISRDALLKRWHKKYDISPCSDSLDGIIFHKKINFFVLPEFREGLFEVQDEGSQIIASLIDPSPHDQVLDFCAGSGGKTLAFAPKMNNQGQIYLYDIRAYPLLQAKKRLKRANIQNAQIIEKGFLKNLSHKMDWILVDVPCSGSGTLRRNPDMKWKFSLSLLENLQQTQCSIFHHALSFLKKGGYIVYATCSILKKENEHQIAYFLKTYNLQEKKRISWLPKKNKKDGFFASLLQKL